MILGEWSIKKVLQNHIHLAYSNITNDSIKWYFITECWTLFLNNYYKTKKSTLNQGLWILVIYLFGKLRKVFGYVLNGPITNLQYIL